MNNGKVNYSNYNYIFVIFGRFWSVIFGDFGILFGNFSQIYEINDF